ALVCSVSCHPLHTVSGHPLHLSQSRGTSKGRFPLAWKRQAVSEQRLQFVIRADSGQETMRSLCEEFEISRPTGYLWLERYRACEQLQELAEMSRRPQHSPRQTSQAVEARLIQLRQKYPDWGAKKLVKLLEREGIHLPRITAHRILLRNGLVRPQDRH